jgi:hypothetical protein
VPAGGRIEAASCAALASARELSREAGAVPARDARQVSWGGLEGGWACGGWVAVLVWLSGLGAGELRSSKQEYGELGG